jgi:hypothetical protein
LCAEKCKLIISINTITQNHLLNSYLYNHYYSNKKVVRVFSKIITLPCLKYKVMRLMDITYSISKTKKIKMRFYKLIMMVVRLLMSHAPHTIQMIRSQMKKIKNKIRIANCKSGLICIPKM